MLKYAILIIITILIAWYVWLFVWTPNEASSNMQPSIESAEEVISGWNYFEIRKLFNYVIALSNIGFEPMLKFDEINKKVTIKINIEHKSQEQLDLAQQMFKNLKLDNKLELQIIYRRN